MSLILETDSGSGANITSELAIGEYTATGTVLLRASVRLSNLNGAAATITRVLRHKDSGGTMIREVFPEGTVTFAKRANADTMYGFEVGPVLLKSGEKVETRVLSSNGSDSNVTWSVDYIDCQQVDVEKISADATAADNVETAFDGTGGQALTLGSITVNNASGTAVTFTSTGSNGHGFVTSGNGSGHGHRTVGGATGAGFNLVGGASSGEAMLLATGAANAHGISVTTSGSGHAFLLNASGATGNAIQLTAGNVCINGSSTNGAGVAITGGTLGMDIAGTGANDGCRITGGATGNGLVCRGGATSGDGLRAIAVGGGDGLDCVGVGGSGVDARADITGDLTGSINGFTATAISHLFTVASGKTYTNDAVAQSLVYEITNLAGAGALEWSVDQKKQIRKALGITGGTTDTSGVGLLDLVKAQTDKLTFNSDNDVLVSLNGETVALTAASITATSFATGAITNDALAANVLTDTNVTAALANKMADHFWRRTAANVEASANGDTLVFHGGYGAMAKLVNKIDAPDTGSTLSVYKADGVTVLGTQTMTTSTNARQITGLA